MSGRALPARHDLRDVAAVVSRWPADHADWFAAFVDLGPGRTLCKLARVLRDQSGGNPSPSERTLQRASAAEHWLILVRVLVEERAGFALAEATERIALNADAAVSKLVDLLDAEHTLVSPTGDVFTVPDAGMQLRAAESLLDRLGVVKAGRLQVQHSGPGGGPIPVAAVTVSMNLGDKSPGELAAMLRDQIALRSASPG
jgi:hypothetical protein